MITAGSACFFDGKKWEDAMESGVFVPRLAERGMVASRTLRVIMCQRFMHACAMRVMKILCGACDRLAGHHQFCV